VNASERSSPYKQRVSMFACLRKEMAAIAWYLSFLSTQTHQRTHKEEEQCVKF